MVAARDYLTAFVDRMANVGALDVQCAEEREELQRLIEAGDADDETIAGYRSLLEVLQPLSAEEAVGPVVDQSGWAAASRLISDEVVDGWVALRLQRVLRRQDRRRSVTHNGR